MRLTPAFKAGCLFLASVFVLDYLLSPASRALLPGSILALTLCGAIWLASGSPAVQRLGNLLLIVGISLVVGILGAEIVFRTVLLRPGVPRNERGFQENIASTWPEAVPVDRRPGRRRILGLADSFGRAGGEGNFLFLLQRQLQAAGQDVEAVNLSEWGYELRDELAVLHRFGTRYRPDVVLHSFFAGNDFHLPSEDLAFFGNVPMRYSPGLRPVRPRWLLSRKGLESVVRARRNSRMVEEEFGGQPSVTNFPTKTFLALEKKRLSRASSREELDAAWPEVSRLLDSIRQESERAGASYAMVVHPYPFQVNSKLQQEMAAQFGLEPSPSEIDLPQSHLASYCESRNIPCLDLLPALRASDADGPVYLLNDHHYNQRGNELAARELLDFLQTSVLEPRVTIRAVP